MIEVNNGIFWKYHADQLLLCADTKSEIEESSDFANVSYIYSIPDGINSGEPPC